MKAKHALLIIVLLTPLCVLLFRLFAGSGVEEPVKYIYAITGSTALILLYITTTISMIRKKINLIRYRRTVGLFAFFYALLHMLNFVVLDMELDVAEAIHETLEKPFIYLGMSAFLILLFMAITSLRIFFSKYYKYHKVIYLAIVLASVHFAMAQKALDREDWGYIAIMVLIGLFKLMQRTGIMKL